jgi:hypothetical protein
MHNWIDVMAAGKELQGRSWTIHFNMSQVVFYCLIVPIGILDTMAAAAAFHFAMKRHM